MRKLICLILIGLITLPLSACNPGGNESLVKISAPENKNAALYGLWEIYGYKPNSSTDIIDEKAESMIGKKAAFNQAAAILGNESCVNPVYKYKSVNSMDYLLYQYKINPGYLDINDESIQVFSITSENHFFNEIIINRDSKAIVNMDGIFLYMRKISDTIDSSFLEEYTSENQKSNGTFIPESGNTAYSGLLIGLSSPKDTRIGPSSQYAYRTLWISYQDKQMKDIYGMEDLFVPRKSGFWKVGVTRESASNSTGDRIFAYPVDKENTNNTAASLTDNISGTILYAGNDYVSAQIYPAGGINDTGHLQLLPMDNINSSTPIKISDIAGESGKKAMYESADQFLNSLGLTTNKSIYGSPSEESFYVSRRNGHWVMKGRLYTKSGDNTWADYNIKIIPPSRLVSYDELCLPWNAIVMRVPDAVDAYTSPNRDMAVITAGNTLLVYTIDNSELSINPSVQFKLKNKETVVMAEWCTGKYTEKWSQEFMKNNTYKVTN